MRSPLGVTLLMLLALAIGLAAMDFGEHIEYYAPVIALLMFALGFVLLRRKGTDNQ